ISLSYQQATGFPRSELPISPDNNPLQLAKIRLREAQLLLSKGEFETLITSMRQALVSETLPPKLRQELTAMLRKGLVAQIQKHAPNSEDLLSQLHSLASTPDQIREYQRVQADHLAHVGNFPDALKAYLDILREFPPDERIVDET